MILMDDCVAQVEVGHFLRQRIDSRTRTLFKRAGTENVGGGNDGETLGGPAAVEFGADRQQSPFACLEDLLP